MVQSDRSKTLGSGRKAMASARRPVTIMDIAEVAGVSKSTVSLVLKASSLVKTETRERVQRAMQTMGYVYNRGAASLRKARSSVVGMVINDLSNPFFAELAIGIEQALRHSGYIPYLAHTAESVARQAEVVLSMREHGAAGIILCPALGTDAAELANLSAPGLPIVLAMRRIAGARLPSVSSDSVGGAQRATQYLIGLGHRRIAFLGGAGQMVVRQDRFAGYQQALQAANIPYDPALTVESMPTKEGGFQAMGAILDGSDTLTPVTATVCFNDVVAIGAMLAINRRGLHVGRDMSVVGFDDTAEARHVSPPLTTIAVDPAGLGKAAAGMLLRHIADPDFDFDFDPDSVPTIENYICEARLVIRESCQPLLRKDAIA
jgi:LacI family transcriptional regulator